LKTTFKKFTTTQSSNKSHYIHHIITTALWTIICTKYTLKATEEHGKVI